MHGTVPWFSKGRSKDTHGTATYIQTMCMLIMCSGEMKLAPIHSCMLFTPFGRSWAAAPSFGNNVVIGRYNHYWTFARSTA